MLFPKFKSFALVISFLILAAPERRALAQNFQSECISSYTNSFKQSSRGINPPRGQANKYCSCAEAAIATGDTMSKAVEMCTKMIKNIYGYK